MTKSKFVTIVAPENVRSEFTYVRQDLKTTDKQLMQALWNIAMNHTDELRQEVVELKMVAEHLKEVAKITRGDLTAPSHCSTEETIALPAAAKAKVKKTAVKKEAKPKPVKKVVVFEGKEEPETFVGEDDDDMGCLVVDGTK